MHRFFVDPQLLTGVGAMNCAPTNLPGTEDAHVGAQFIAPKNIQHIPTITLPSKWAHQIRDVLHIRIGEHVILLDNSGDEVVAEVVKSNRAGVEVLPIERRPGKSTSPVQITLCQGLLKSARFEWILEKGTELGVTTFVPTLCRRSMAGLEHSGPARLQRWQHIIQEATEQCGRARLPELLSIRPLAQALKDIPANALAIMPWEEERERSLRDVLHSQTENSQSPQSTKTIVLFIGPEGGLTPEEVKLAESYDVHSVTLGTRILRAETAALAAIANVMYELDV